MNHPSREKLVLLIHGEAGPSDARALRRHLRDCPECAAEVSSWRRVIRTLPSWRVPEPRRSMPPWFSPARIVWTAAAALVVAVTLAGGWLTARQARQLNELRTRVAALEQNPSAVAASSASQNRISRLAGGLSGMEARLDRLARLCSQGTNEAERVIAAVGEVNRANREALAEIAAADKAARDDDRLSWTALVRASESRQERGLALLRQDLETVASVADDQIQLTRANLVQISAAAKAKLWR